MPEVQVTGTLAHGHYEDFVPKFERLVNKHDKTRVLVEMSQFHGWEAKALWHDINFDLKHFKSIERLAMVGRQKWQPWMAAFCKAFTATVAICYFDHDQADAARAWLGGKQVNPTL